MNVELPDLFLPPWVPANVRRYLLHTEAGLSIRDLARASGCHASTVLRQIRRVEVRRDDLLVDAALAGLAETFFQRDSRRARPPCFPQARCKEPTMTTAELKPEADAGDPASFDEQAVRILRRLCEAGAVLAVAEDMEKAVVMRGEDDGRGTRTAVVDTEVARVLALRDWISCAMPGRISRYHITSAGRAALSRLLAEQENRLRNAQEIGLAASAPRGSRDIAGNDGQEAGSPQRRVRYSMAESPLVALARRKDRDGRPFLSPALVGAGERLREDFELAQMGPRVAQNWDRFLTGGDRGGFQNGGEGRGPEAARDRVAGALRDLGPGLGDVVLRCCCFLEGMEQAEKRMGWSARSGKIVLKIALQRLNRHYRELGGGAGLIG